MAKSRRESPLFSISFLPQEGGTGVTKGFAEGKVECLARAEMPHRISSPLTGED